MAALMVSAAAFTVPESGYVVSACVFLMQVPAPACAPLCVPGLSLQSIIHYHYFNPFNTHCNVQCPVQYYDYARIGVHGLSIAAFAFTRSPGRILKS
jgi:hypothetical protein